MIALFEAHPELAERLPRVALGDFPTPVQRLERLGDGRCELFVKRDDLSAEPYGGNKVRKLEFLLGRAVACGAKRVQTLGAAGSNHALATAIYARRLGLECTSLLYHQPVARYVARNLLFAKRSGATLELAANDLAAAGMRLRGSFHIPMGGSSVLGAIGFVNAGFELAAQVRRDELPRPQWIYVALGTMGTAAGLLLGLRAAGLDTRVVAVRVVAERIASPARLRRLYRNTNRLLHRLDPAFPRCPFEGIEIREEFFGGKYARFTPEGMRAVALARDRASLALEGTYTGKTFAALLEDLRNPSMRDQVIVFWNTFNSRPFPADLAEEDYRELPEGLHRYFEEPAQLLDD
ncbi:MAG: 1-aminocyclopropane-1-carboxylate deaminase/D-cysteine desulfhydrase [Gammaproteobacteria bacterium]